MQRFTRALSCGAAVAVFTVGSIPVADAQIVDVPGPNLPSIQSGIDALPNGGTVRIAPATYRENLVINGQQIVLQNADATNSKRPVIKSVDRQAAVVAYLNGAGGALINLELHGGAIGIGAGVFDAEQSTDVSTSLHVQGVQITKSGRGIAGQFLSLTISGSEVSKCKVHGVSLKTAGELLIDGLSSHDNQGIGLLIINDVAPPGSPPRDIRNSEFFKNKGGGIGIRGGALPVTIDHCNAVNNEVFGLDLVGAASTTITNSTFSFSRAAGDRWGDGVRIFRSNPVAITASTMSFNARAGISAFGCVGKETHADLTDDTLDKDKFDLVLGAISGCTPQATAMVIDISGNTCDGGPCIAEPIDLTPAPATVTP
jgi:Right handed beta helix region